ncbi:hypothetical protein SDC9_139142 [bioreactor metagenome]|uniref:Uncharacterized protein n=1 Tax=bioreactor metagenome TaxID=1076179 RepID=A0A645DSB3_9ZZZZ|nr:hypothetical protein [Candidatus Pelethousia sp.]
MTAKKIDTRRESAKLTKMSDYLARRSETAIIHDDFSEAFDSGYYCGRKDALDDVRASIVHRPVTMITLERPAIKSQEVKY